MKNSIFKYILIISILVIIIGFIVFFNVNNPNNQQSEFDASRTSTNVNTQKNNNKKPPVETQISTFSTEILDDSPGRLTNIRISCDILNGTIVNPGEVFSFNEIVGQPTKERGYQEAAIILDGKRQIGIGRSEIAKLVALFLTQ